MALGAVLGPLLGYVGSTARNGEHKPFGLKCADGVSDDMFAYVVSLPESPVGRERPASELAIPYALAKNLR